VSAPLPLTALVALALGASLVGCGPKRAASPGEDAAVAALPVPSSSDVVLFDDGVGTELLSFGSAAGSPEDPAATASRARAADGVTPVVISTVTRDRNSQEVAPTYVLGLRLAGSPLRGKAPTEAGQSVEIPPGSPSFQRVQTLGDALVGRKALLFHKDFNDEGQRRQRWRLIADTPRNRGLLVGAI
jgi:hypothetical protein